MADHSSTDFAYQNLLLFIIAIKLRHMVQLYTPSPRERFRFAADATPSLPAMKREEVQSMFAAQLDVFNPISIQLPNADLMRLREDLTIILLHLMNSA